MSKIAVGVAETTEEFEVMINFVDALRPDFVRFYNNGNKSAGRRLCKQLMELRKFSQQLRVEILAIQKNADKPA